MICDMFSPGFKGCRTWVSTTDRNLSLTASGVECIKMNQEDMNAHQNNKHFSRNIDSKAEPARSWTNLSADSRCKVRMPVSILLHDKSASVTQCPDNTRLAPEQAPFPRPNTVSEECVAVTSMLLCFGYNPSPHHCSLLLSES